MRGGRASVSALSLPCAGFCPCAAFSFAADLPQIPAKMRDLRRNHFFRRGDALALSAPLICRKNFSADARCRARVLFRRIFRSEFRGENAFLEAPQNDTFCKFERKFIHFAQFFIDKRHRLPYN